MVRLHHIVRLYLEHDNTNDYETDENSETKLMRLTIFMMRHAYDCITRWVLHWDMNYKSLKMGLEIALIGCVHVQQKKQQN